MSRNTLGFKQYDPKEYWDARAKKGETVHQKVCVFGAPDYFNELMENLQRSILISFLPETTLRGKKVLEIGCGAGRWCSFFTGYGAEYVGVDISKEMIAHAKRRCSKGTFKVIDGKSLPFPDASFDIVVTITVLHHVPDNMKELLVTEICRVTKPGGKIVIIEDVVSTQTSREFNMFPLTLEEWVALFEHRGCQLVGTKKHKFLQRWLFKAVKNVPAPLGIALTKAWERVIEPIAVRVFPQLLFAGAGLLFVKAYKHQQECAVHRNVEGRRKE